HLIQENFNLEPEAIIEKLGLTEPIFQQTAALGHFGRPDLDLPWEKLDMVETLQEAAQKHGFTPVRKLVLV
ncbi:methionine adenosyltransferase domain-containing protein, partial [bacterium]|nr:methionine adenosyltransferase domain-containing protein [bacterium]